MDELFILVYKINFLKISEISRGKFCIWPQGTSEINRSGISESRFENYLLQLLCEILNTK